MPKKERVILPKFLDIVGRLYEVKLAKLKPHQAALCDNHRTSIYIDKTRSQQAINEDLFHEHLHGVFNGLGLDVELSKIDQELEEWIISRLSPGLYASLRANNVNFRLKNPWGKGSK